MKRVFIMLAAVLMTALAVFAIHASAYEVKSPVGEIGSPTGALTAKVSHSEAITSHTGSRLLDVQSVTEYDADEIKEDGINTRVATIWIVCISAVFFVAIMIFVVRLAKKNQGEK